jgi:LPXTG-motif cell wall-anchored protein
MKSGFRSAFAILAFGLLAVTAPVQAASSITGIQFTNVQVFAAAACAQNDHIVDFQIVVTGTPGGSGSFNLVMTLGGSGVPISYPNPVADANLGVGLNGFTGTPGTATTFNGTLWTTLNGTATITVTADGVGPATLSVNCVSKAVTIQNFPALAVPTTNTPVLALIGLLLAGSAFVVMRRRRIG